MSQIADDTIGARVKRLRTELDLSLPKLAELTQISKSYLWNLENKPEHQRPSGETLYSLAKALGTTMSALLGRELLHDTAAHEPSESLRAFAEKADLSEGDVDMLASIRWRGGEPQTVDSWQFIFQAIQARKDIDKRAK